MSSATFPAPKLRGSRNYDEARLVPAAAADENGDDDDGELAPSPDLDGDDHDDDEDDYDPDEYDENDEKAPPRARGPPSRASHERRRRDYATLHAEEEAEQLLRPEDGAGRRFFRGLRWGSRPTPRAAANEPFARDRASRAEWGPGRDGVGEGVMGREDTEAELMFKVEDGPGSVRSASSSRSGSEDARMHGRAQEGRRWTKKGGWGTGKFGRFAAIHVLIIAAFLALLYGAYRATRASQRGHSMEGLARFWNGSHEFGPTTIVISLDGFRADFLFRNITPAMSAFVREGVSPKYMTPSFPSLTFPNHFTLVTGRYPESHGIVGNSFWDPITEKEFYYTDPDRSMTPEWWNAEPIWETAELQGIKTAIHMWPGSEAHIGAIEPAYVDKFNMHEPLDKKIDRVVQWLDLPGPNDPGASEETPRPQLIAFYVPDVDSDGHAYGPNSTTIRSTITAVDSMLDSLFKDIDARNLTDIVNVIIVSDHGMATTDTSRLLQYENLIDPALIEHTDGWPLYGLRPYDHSDAHLQSLYQSLLSKSQQPEYVGAFDVYLRDVNMPERYHFSRNPRIAPLWIVPRPGWAIVTRDEFDVAAGVATQQVYHPRGLHGYDHEHPLMRAIFLARGPAFPHPKGSRVPPFQNIELYNILCDSLGLTPQPNNGTLRLPFTAVSADSDGIDGEDQESEVVEDLPGEHEDVAGIILPPELFGVENLSEVETSVPDVPSGENEGSEDTEGKGSWQQWIDWIKGKFDDGKTWAAGVLGFGGGEDGNGEVPESN